MKLKAKFEDEDIKLGEVVDAVFMENERIQVNIADKAVEYFYDSINEFRDKWEDYHEELKVGYIIDPMEEDYVSADDSGYEESDIERAKELGLWLETKEEAERAVEKLKAFKRLKGKGFRFNGWNTAFCEIDFDVPDSFYPINGNMITNETEKDLDICFGGEE